MGGHDAGPLGQPLGDVIAADHLELSQLVVEISRQPPTPGVVPGLLSTLDHRARVHLAVCERLVFPVLDAAGRGDLADRVADDHGELRSRLRSLVDAGTVEGDALGSFEAELADHIAFEEEVVVPAVDDAGGRDVAGLGSRFSDLADTELTVPTPRGGHG
jgi:iron-sulfur cluster repair protein YtfE (RIC family)